MSIAFPFLAENSLTPVKDSFHSSHAEATVGIDVPFWDHDPL